MSIRLKHLLSGLLVLICIYAAIMLIMAFYPVAVYQISQQNYILEELQSFNFPDFSSDKVNENYETGAPLARGTNWNGEMLLYYESGAQMGRAFFKNGVEDGKEKTFYETGALMSESSYKAGEKNGLDKGYYPSGTLFYEGVYKNGKREGIVKEYTEDGRLRFRDSYSNGQMINRDFLGVAPISDGVLRIYYQNGKVLGELEYKDGKLNGQSRYFFDNGQLWMEQNYVNNQAEGVQKVFYQDGKIFGECQMKQGSKEGFRRFYLHDGSFSEDLYHENKLTGIGKRFYSDGKLRVETVCSAPGIVKESKSYHKNGKIDSVFSSTNGERHGVIKVYDESGNLVLDGKMVDRKISGNVQSFHSTGKPLLKMQVVNGQVEGMVKIYSQDGSGLLRYELPIKNGQVCGVVLKYSEMSKPLRAELYNKNIFAGLRKDYDPKTGNLAWEEYSWKGFLHGLIRGYSDSGVLRQEDRYVVGFKQNVLPLFPFGNAKSFFTSGLAREEASFQCWLRHGATKNYYVSGKLWKFENYRWGKLDGQVQTFYESGKLATDEFFKNGKRQGINRRYFENGKLWEESEWDNGERIGNLKLYSNDGSLLN